MITWTGATKAWGAGSNWSGTNLPVTSDSLAFGAAGAGGLNLNNDLTDGSFNVAGITFGSGAGAFIIGNGTTTANVGSTFVLTGPITNNSTALQTINNPFSMAAVRTFTTTAGGGDIKLGGKISGALGGIAKAGAGTLSLYGDNSFSGGVTLIAGTLKINSSAALGTGTFDIGAAGGGAAVTLDALSAPTITNAVDINQDFTYIGTNTLIQNTGAVALVNGTRAITVSANPLTLGGVIGDGGGGYGLTKLGAGTLILSGSAASTFTGGLSVYAGTLELDFTNLGTPTNLINSGNTLTLGSGTLSVKGSKTGSTSQAFGGLTIAGGARILVNPRGGAGTTATIPLGSIATVNAVGRSLLVGTGAGAGGGSPIITTTDKKDGQGIYGGRVVYMLGGGTSVDWATAVSVSSPYTFGAYGGYTTMAAGAASDSSNDITGSLAIAGNHTHNTLKVTNGATLALGANTLTLTSGGLLSTGGTDASMSTISGDAGATRLMGGDNGSGSYDLIVHQYNTGGLTISAVIGDNGTHPTALTKSGGGPLTLSGSNTYSGDTIVTKGTLSISNAYLNDAAAVKIDLDARMELSFTGSDQIAELWLGGDMMAPGTYDGSTSTPIDYRSYFTGTGSLHVVLVRLPGDTNADGVVDAADFVALKKNLGQGTALGAAAGEGNFNADGGVNWADLGILMSNMGSGSGGMTAAPEPCSAMLLVFGAAALLRRRRVSIGRTGR